jgi:hypothetical protein
MISEITNENAHIAYLMSTGCTLGLLHVLAGPDHLSALAALAVGTSWRAFMLGFRWGVGHSTGLIVVAIVFIALKGDIDLRALGRYCDTLVGIFMIALGCYGVIGALKSYREKRNKRDPDWEVGTEMDEQGNKVSSSTADHSVQHHHQSPEGAQKQEGTMMSFNNSNNDLESLRRTSSVRDTKKTSGLGSTHTTTSRGSNSEQPNATNFSVYHDHDDHHHISLSEACPILPYIDMHDPTTQRIISFSIGLLHGVAGPGGILGVLPAVEMQNWRYSFVYLGSFILTSTISMGTFAALYGELTRRIGATAESIELGLSVFSAAMSILVGTVWLVMSILGKLDSLFH